MSRHRMVLDVCCSVRSGGLVGCVRMLMLQWSVSLWILDDQRSDHIFFFQAEDGIRDLVRSRGLGDVYKRQPFYL